MNWGKPKFCSECGAAVPQHSGAGRPRVTCTAECGKARTDRLERESLELEQTAALVETPEDRAALDDFNTFAKRGST